MSSQRYERIENVEDDVSPRTSIDHERQDQQQPTPASPPPSFHSRASSPTGRPTRQQEPLISEAERALADSFDTNSDDDDDENDDINDEDARRMQGGQSSSWRCGWDNNNNNNAQETTPGSAEGVRRPILRRVTEIPVFTSPVPGPTTTTGRTMPRTANDGVFANLSAKPDGNEKTEDQPPSYEQAAADATPPYWETTILAPGFGTDEVYIDGLPVGSVFSFAWNGLISMSFQFVGFLLTYLLHTTHAAKNGSKAGLGISLIQYGFAMKGGSSRIPISDPSATTTFPQPNDPNSHDITGLIGADTDDAGNNAAAMAAAALMDTSGGNTPVVSTPDRTDSSTWSGVSNSDWLAYALMILGWFILIKSVSNYVRARRHEQLVLQSPERGLNVPIVAEGERPETVV
ncbi:MAG: hypothetical protein M1823_002965 [Watsoniomyces obsoletus]|nr:MAG: hypothetical protein M1823_002965 [Watsoniomyces obsoletus]